MFFGNPKQKGEHFYSQPADKRMRQHQRWMKRCGWIGGSVFFVLVVVVVGVAAYSYLVHSNRANPFRDPVVVPLTEQDLGRMV